MDGKSRQSSGGKSSIFGRKLHKERPNSDRRTVSDDHLIPPQPSGASTASGSRSSKHGHRGSISSIAAGPAPDDPAGLALTAGVITSIPYESLSADSKSPIPVDYLPRGDQKPLRREPVPHHLNQGGRDFHQYPSIAPSSMSGSGGHHPSGPRPPPGMPVSTSQSSDRGTMVQQLSRGGSAGSAYGGTNGYFPNVSSSYPANPRISSDQASVYSVGSSATRGSNVFTPPPADLDSGSWPNFSLAPRQSQQPQHSHHHTSILHGHPPGFSSTASFSPDGFNLPRPSDDKIVEREFLELMHKRGWHNLPEQARRQMLAYPAAKKWTLVHQDKLTEWQGEQKRRQHARQTGYGNADGLGLLGRVDEEGSPEWFVKKVLDDSITPKQLQSLSVSLRTQPIRYVCYSLNQTLGFTLVTVAGLLHPRRLLSI
ncbi:hypothetical protein GP486_006207 [Trichoglossum hirsutum]|uniref:Formin GTPase-binding domain-containing protein n=1 Tax=Trichoglossum hirsutum TaxID=265104 RepID=A0A9P8IHG2_9PEZI|nr:hypothetical protein GP486_006207 [Trichoglossum hirsutum]